MSPYSEVKAIPSCLYETYNRKDLEKSFDDFIATDIINHQFTQQCESSTASVPN